MPVRLSSIILLLSSVTAMAAENTKPLRIGVENLDYSPYYTSKGGKYGGFAADLLQAFAENKGYKIEFVPLPVNRLFNDFLAGKVDFKFPDDRFWQADLKKGTEIVYSDPAVAYIDGVMVKPENKGKGAASLKVLGTVRGFTPWEYLDPIKAGKIRLSENDSFPLLLQQGLAGRVDGTYGNVINGKYILREELGKEGGLVFDEGLPHTRSHYLLSTIKQGAVIKEFNAFLKAESKAIDALKKKHHIDL